MEAQTCYNENAIDVIDGITYNFELGREKFLETMKFLKRRRPGDIIVSYLHGSRTIAPSKDGARRDTVLTEAFHLCYETVGESYTERIAKFDTLQNEGIEKKLDAGNFKTADHVANQMALRMGMILATMGTKERLRLEDPSGRGDYMDSRLLIAFRTYGMPGRVAFLHNAPENAA